MSDSPEMIRVAQVAPTIFPVPPADHGGTERVIHDLSVALKRQGVNVTLLAPSDSAADVESVGDLPSLSFLEAKYGTVPPSIPAVLEAARLEDLRIRLDRFDIVHCHGEFFHATLLGERRKHSLTTIHWRVDELDRELFFARFPDLPVAAISASQEGGIPQSNRAGIVHHGIERDRYRFSGETGGYLAFVGRMTDQKRPDKAIRVAKAANRPIRLAGTVDVGNPRYFDSEVRPHLSDTAVYVGPLGDRDKASLLSGADALLFPIDWPEPFGLVMIEAMACGTPVIAWRKGSVPEVVEEGLTGFIVDTEEEAVAAIGRLHTLDRARIRARFEERFTSDRMAQDYIALYRKLLGR
ncbi:glycosyltransferase family 4 protein [Mesorhizobium sp. RP14(2022)]|uniref:Glycosyltransferase family 4 protein n=2 Tax=Mesorhizobium liriopis TaxID=2953882 RepID=A0ABT1C2J9_9HYPH|nr:glycosyltransferase family 4 protein [Mesorhizobium liriopis]MCO6049045.1 glycosyltransferase family 4 protein [Mesorhizobium liriopis]